MLSAPITTTSSAVTSHPQHAQRALDTLTLAFASDPPNRWMYRSADHYLRHFPQFARALGGRAFDFGTADVNDDYSAVALWLPPGTGPDEQALADLFDRTVAPDRKSGLFAVVEQMGRLHPQEPHWYLPFVGVDPARQGQGLGSVLLAPRLAECDRAGLPAYLESSNPRNRPFYERLGFRAVSEIRIGSCPPITPMLRQPRAPVAN